MIRPAPNEYAGIAQRTRSIDLELVPVGRAQYAGILSEQALIHVLFLHGIGRVVLRDILVDLVSCDASDR